MKMKQKYLLIIVIVLLFTSCSNTKTEEIEASDEISSAQEFAATSFDEAANPMNNETSTLTDLQKLYLEYDAKIIESMKRYNSEKSEYLVKEDDIFDRSSEGGHIVKEYKDNKFVAYQTELLGEMGKIKYNFYSFDGYTYLIITIERYNAPFYYTKEMIDEEKLDMEPFDPQKSVLVSTEEFIKDNKCLYKIDRENQELTIVQDADDIRVFNMCNEDAEMDLSEETGKYELTDYENYIKTLYKNAEEFNDKISSAVTTADLVKATGDALWFWDKELNIIYSRLIEKLPESEMEELRKEQRLWIKERDESAYEYAAEFKGGSFATVAYNDSLLQQTKQRTLELISIYYDAVKPKDEPPDIEYLPVVRVMAISDDKPEFTFIQKLTEPFEGEDEFFSGFGAAVIQVYEDGIINNPFDSIIIERLYPIAWGEFSIIDVNFDGYKDVVALTDRQGNQGMDMYDCFVWNEEIGKFEAAPFPDWGFVSVDIERRLLLASWRNWAAGHGWAIYEYIDDTLTKTHECERNFLNTLADGVEMIHFHEEHLINGKMQVIFDGDITEEELDNLLFDDDLWRVGSEKWVGVWEVNRRELD